MLSCGVTGSQLPDPNLVRQAESAIAEFDSSRVPGIWPGLDKQQIIADMRSRLRDPFQVNQGSQPFCGPAAVLFELIRRDPVRYVQMCRNLFQVGGFHTQTDKWIAPSDRLRETQGNLHMGQADWMVLSTLRESENLLFPVEPDAPKIVRNISGMTKSWEMKGWVREILGYRNIKYHHAFVVGDLTALQEAANIIAAGGVAFALITSEALLTNNPPPIPYPSHWVALLGNISIHTGTAAQPNSARVGFDVYTWSRKMHVDVAEKPFRSYFWGVVTGLA